MKAVAECATDMVRVLLEKNADPNVMSRNGKTPLMYAVELVSRYVEINVFIDSVKFCCDSILPSFPSNQLAELRSRKFPKLMKVLIFCVSKSIE